MATLMFLLLSRNVERSRAGDRFGYGYHEPIAATEEGRRLLRSHFALCKQRVTQKRNTKALGQTSWMAYLPKCGSLSRLRKNLSQSWQLVRVSCRLLLNSRVQTASRNPIFSPSGLNPDGSSRKRHKSKGMWLLQNWLKPPSGGVWTVRPKNIQFWKGIRFESDSPAVWMQPISPILAWHSVLVGCFTINQK